MILVAVLLLAYLLLPPFALFLALAFCFWLVWAPSPSSPSCMASPNALVVLARLLLTVLVLFFGNRRCSWRCSSASRSRELG